MRSAFYDEVIGELSERELSKNELHKRKLALVKKHGLKKIPTDIDILLHATMEERKSMKLRAKPMRTRSGVSPITIMCAPLPCPHGKCTFCPDHLKEGIPMSYTGKEPASMRGMRWKWDAYFQTFNRLEQYVVMGHDPHKCEVIINGGTMPSFPLKYQVDFIRDMFCALNDFGDLFYEDGELLLDSFKEFFELPGSVKDKAREQRIRERMQELKQEKESTLEQEQARNERNAIRCIGLTFETRPDCGLLPHGNLMLRLGGTRIELGVQSVYDECLAVTNRCHDSQLNKASVQVLRDLGFKLNFHMMPGLPGADKRRISYERDLEGLREVFSDPDYRPDMLKLYPCMVMPNTPLFKDYEQGLFEPMGTEEATKLLREFLPEVPEYCRVMRVQRDIPTYRTAAGVDKTNLRQIVHDEPVDVRDIRAREVKDQLVNPDAIEFVSREFEASGGTEFFVSVEDTSQDVLLGFVRMRFPASQPREEITASTAIIRELHVYGFSTPLSQEGDTQHQGWGSKLLRYAEELARERGKDKMVIISGVGVRAYYIDKHGYEHDGPYVSKRLD